jgi:hypothetical protein
MTQISGSSDFNIYSYNFEPIVLIDEVSSTEYYIGVSNNGNNQGGANWKIKKISQVSTVWKTEFPNGDQSFAFIWNSRGGYIYS